MHANSPRAGKIFLKLNCAALPTELVESELFGYERGAFTGAFQKRLGMFEMANGGTLLLDEIGDMDVRLQAKLLQVLQDHEFQRIGGKEVINVDVRVISATHRDLDKAIVRWNFPRRPLLSPERDQPATASAPGEDRRHPVLCGVSAQRSSSARNTCSRHHSRLKHAMLTYHWPGNVRELENTVRQLIVLRDPDLLVSELHARASKQLPSAPPVPSEPPARPAAPKAVEQELAKTPVWEQVKKAKRQAEADAIVAALNATRWNRRQAADLLQIDYKALLYKMKTLGVRGKDRIASAQSPEKGPRLVAAAGGGS